MTPLRALVPVLLLATLVVVRWEYRALEHGYRCAQVTPSGQFVRWLPLEYCEGERR